MDRAHRGAELSEATAREPRCGMAWPPEVVGAAQGFLSPSLPGGQQTVGPHFVAQPKGYLFDVDGTLLDSMPLFLKSWQAVCPEYGLEMTLDVLIIDFATTHSSYTRW